MSPLAVLNRPALRELIGKKCQHHADYPEHMAFAGIGVLVEVNNPAEGNHCDDDSFQSCNQLLTSSGSQTDDGCNHKKRINPPADQQRKVFEGSLVEQRLAVIPPRVDKAKSGTKPAREWMRIRGS